MADALPSWECQADCQTLYYPDGYCYHGAPWAEEVEGPNFLVGTSYQPICASLACGQQGSVCGAGVQACVSGSCANECMPSGGSYSCTNEDVTDLPGFTNSHNCDTTIPTQGGGGVCVVQ